MNNLPAPSDPESEAKITCATCGAEILLATAKRTGGVCMPCAQGVSPARLAMARQQAGRVPSFTRRDVEAAVQKWFPECDRTKAREYLSMHESAHEVDVLARIQMAILDLSQGDLDRLVRYADHAYHIDYRDVLLWSESPTCRPTG